MKRPLIIAYDSRTGNTEWFAKQLGFPTMPVTSFEGEVNADIFLVTHTFGKGSVPENTHAFLNRYAGNTIGTCVSGDTRWGALFALAGDKIRLEYEIPLVRKIDIRGYPEDVRSVKEWIQTWLKMQDIENKEWGR